MVPYNSKNNYLGFILSSSRLQIEILSQLDGYNEESFYKKIKLVVKIFAKIMKVFIWTRFE